MKSNTLARLPNQKALHHFSKGIENLSSELNNTIEVRELDKRYTHANPKRGKCTMSCCSNKATHWLTRQSSEYSQSDMICYQHAILWTEVRDLIS